MPRTVEADDTVTIQVTSDSSDPFLSSSPPQRAPSRLARLLSGRRTRIFSQRARYMCALPLWHSWSTYRLLKLYQNLANTTCDLLWTSLRQDRTSESAYVMTCPDEDVKTVMCIVLDACVVDLAGTMSYRFLGSETGSFAGGGGTKQVWQLRLYDWRKHTRHSVFLPSVVRMNYNTFIDCLEDRFPEEVEWQRARYCWQFVRE